MSIPTFINARLYEQVEQNAEGGPTYLTTLIELASGGEKTNIEWAYPKIQWDISFGVDSPIILAQVKSMFNNCFGRAIPFRFKDWEDYVIGDQVAQTAQTLATGDGTTTVFQTFKVYSITGIDGMTVYNVQRKITRLVTGTFLLYLNGVQKTEGTDFTVDYDTGLITFASAPGNGVVISVYSEFDVPVRFMTDIYKTRLTWTGAGDIPPIMIREVKE